VEYLALPWESMCQLTGLAWLRRKLPVTRPLGTLFPEGVRALTLPSPLWGRAPQLKLTPPSPLWGRAPQLKPTPPSPLWGRAPQLKPTPPSPLWGRAPQLKLTPPSPLWGRAPQLKPTPPSPLWGRGAGGEGVVAPVTRTCSVGSRFVPWAARSCRRVAEPRCATCCFGVSIPGKGIHNGDERFR